VQAETSSKGIFRPCSVFLIVQSITKDLFVCIMLKLALYVYGLSPVTR